MKSLRHSLALLAASLLTVAACSMRPVPPPPPDAGTSVVHVTATVDATAPAAPPAFPSGVRGSYPYAFPIGPSGAAAHTVLVSQGSTSTVTVIGPGTSGQTMLSGGASGDPSYGTAGVPTGGTGATTFTTHGLLVGEGTSTVVATAAGTSGQTLLSGGAGGDPAYGTAAVPTGGTGATTFTTHGVLLGEGTSAVSATAAGTTGQTLLSGGSGGDPSYGTAGVPTGGTGVTTLTTHGVLLGEGTSAISATAAGTTGQTLLSGGSGGDPSYGTAGVATGGTGATTFTVHGVLLGETTSAVVATSAGSIGQSLAGQGAADPIFEFLYGSWTSNVTSASSPFSPTASQRLVAVDTTSAPVTVNTPATPSDGQTFFVKDATGQAGVNPITIAGAGGATVDNPQNAGNYAASVNITIQGSCNGWKYRSSDTKWIGLFGF